MVHTPVIPALRRLRQEVHQFKASLGYKEKTYLKNQNNPQHKHSLWTGDSAW
jgi:hypothetical protein